MTEREEYIKEYRRLGDQLIYNEKLPFATDILEFTDGKVSPRLKRIFDMMENEDELQEQIHFSPVIPDTDSSTFIQKVIDANVSSIRKAGSLYKQIQFSADDIRIIEEDCGSKGTEVFVADEDVYNYRIEGSYIMVDGKLQVPTRDVIGTTVTVRTPLTCKHHRRLCAACAGQLPNIKNIGSFSTLMITEPATQAALSSMNKGELNEDNPITLLNEKTNITDYNDFLEYSDNLLDRLINTDIERRFYEIALKSRIIWEDDGSIRVVSLKTSKTDNLFGNFIFSPSQKNFISLIEAGEINDTSLKCQLGFNNYEDAMREDKC